MRSPVHPVGLPKAARPACPRGPLTKPQKPAQTRQTLPEASVVSSLRTGVQNLPQTDRSRRGNTPGTPAGGVYVRVVLQAVHNSPVAAGSPRDLAPQAGISLRAVRQDLPHHRNARQTSQET
uniref:(northern house mosquito) hypothetical protein n=1 Tax=Culex pipiens TaxID=7175 RepID=A0A8D8AEN4_CULPI